MAIVREVLLVVGFSAYAYGAFLIYPPAALITGGIALMWFAFPPRKRTGK